MPELRVGTLDSLLALSDDLVKVNALVEATATKIQRQVIDLAAVSYTHLTLPTILLV